MYTYNLCICIWCIRVTIATQLISGWPCRSVKNDKLVLYSFTLNRYHQADIKFDDYFIKKNLYKNYLLFLRIFQLLLLNWLWWDDVNTLEKEHIETNRSRRNDHKYNSHYHTWHLLCIKYFLCLIKMCVYASMDFFDFSFCIFSYLHTLKF